MWRTIRNVIEGAGEEQAKYILKKYLCKGKSYEKKYARQVALKNIPKIQCKRNNNEKNSCSSKKSPPPKGPSLIFFFNQKCHVNTFFLLLIYLLKNVKQGDALYVWFSWGV